MQFTGKLVQVLPAQTGQGKNGEWRKQDIILESEGQYPKKVCVSVWGDRMSHLSLAPGEMITVDFDIESREFNGKWYTDVKAWKVTAGNAAPANNSGSSPYTGGNNLKNQGNQNFPSSPPVANSFDEDLPF